MAYAMGYVLTPAPRAEFLNELLTQDTTWPYIEGLKLYGMQVTHREGLPMRKIGMLSIIALLAILALIPRDRSAPVQAPGPLPDKTLSFRIVFGEKQERLEDYSGSLTLIEGKVVNVMPWRLFKEDTVNPDGTWKVHIKRMLFENQPDDPHPLGPRRTSSTWFPPE